MRTGRDHLRDLKKIEDECLARHAADDQVPASDRVGDCCKASSFRVGDRPGGSQKPARLGPSVYVYDSIAAEPCPHSMQRSPRLAAQASRSWSQAEAPLQ